MRKIIHCFLGLGLLGHVAAVQAQNPVPNSGFENWTAGEPDDWSTSNIPNFVTNITQTAPPYSGSLAAYGEVGNTLAGTYPPLLASIDMNGDGFPVSQSWGYLNFYYKYTHAGTSYFYAAATLEDAATNSVAIAYMSQQASVGSYTLASVPFIYIGTNPAACTILFSIADSVATMVGLGNSFVVDEVSLTGTTGLPETPVASALLEKISPNPACGQATAYYALPTGSDVAFELLTLQGRLVKRMDLPGEIPGRHKVEVDVSDVGSGIYLLRMAAAGGVSFMRLGVVR